MLPSIRAAVWGTLAAAASYLLEFISIVLGIFTFGAANDRNSDVLIPYWVFFSIPAILGVVTFLGIWVAEIEAERKRELEDDARERRRQISGPDLP